MLEQSAAPAKARTRTAPASAGAVTPRASPADRNSPSLPAPAVGSRVPSGMGQWQWGSSGPPAVPAPLWWGLRASPALGSAAFCQALCSVSQPRGFVRQRLLSSLQVYSGVHFCRCLLSFLCPTFWAVALRGAGSPSPFRQVASNSILSFFSFSFSPLC